MADRVREPHELSWPSRAAALVAGSACLGAGGVSAFIAHLEAPPIGLLAVGLIFGLVGISGAMPVRVRFQDSEIEFQQRQIAVVLREGVEDAPAEDKEKVAALIDRVAEVAPGVAASAQRAYGYEREVIDSLHGIAQHIPDSSFRTYIDTPGLLADAQIAVNRPAEDGGVRLRLINIEIKAARFSPTNINENALFAHGESARLPRVDLCLLLLTSQSASANVLNLMQKYPWIRLWHIPDPEDTEALEAAIKSAMSGPALSEALEPD